MVSTPKPAARPYRGKYPSRIRSVGGLTGRPGILHIETNDGRAFEVRARPGLDLSSMMGLDVVDLTALAPVRAFRLGFSRATAALCRVRHGQDQTVPADGVTARDVAVAALTLYRGLYGFSLPRASIVLRAAGACARLALDSSGGQDWRAVAIEAAELLSPLFDRAQLAARRRAVRQLRAKHAGSPVAILYRCKRADRPSAPAVLAIRDARRSAERFRDPLRLARYLADKAERGAEVEHGQIFRMRRGKARRTFVLAIVADDFDREPWRDDEGVGHVSDWTRRAKLPGEWVLVSDGSSKRLYDFAGTLARAKRDAWGLDPAKLATLQAKLGRRATSREIAAEAVRLDFERLRRWCQDEWRYVGLELRELPRSRFQVSADRVADLNNPGALGFPIAASLYGVESDAGPYLAELAAELLADA